MKLTGRKATHVDYNVNVEIITEPELCQSKSKHFVCCLVLNEDSTNELRSYNVENLKLLPEEITTEHTDRINNLVDKFYGVGIKEWLPDWSKIKFDHLRMDGDNMWYSHEVPDLEFDYFQSMWRGASKDIYNTNCESHITYKHPDPANAVYNRNSDN